MPTTLFEGFEDGPLGDPVDTLVLPASARRVVYSDEHVRTGAFSATGGVVGSVSGGALEATVAIPAKGTVWAYLTRVPDDDAGDAYSSPDGTLLCEWRDLTLTYIAGWRWKRAGGDSTAIGLYDRRASAGLLTETLVFTVDEVEDQWIRFEATVDLDSVSDRNIYDAAGTLLATSPAITHAADPEYPWNFHNAVNHPDYSYVGAWIDDVTIVINPEEPPVEEIVQVTRQYPRDDEHGYSGGRRLYPPPRLARIIGAQT